MTRVLLVDDDAKVLEITADALISRGYDVTQTQSPEKALSLLKQNFNQFDIILLDWKLSAPIDGDMVLKVIRHIFPDFKTPIIFITAHTHLSSKYLMRLGAYDTLSKPVTLEQLVLAIDRALKKAPPEDPHKLAPAQLDSTSLKRQEVSRKIIDAISEAGSLKGAATKLGCSRASLYRWLKKTGLEVFYIDKEPGNSQKEA